MSVTPTSVSFERMYSDNSGVQYAVRLLPSVEHGKVVQIENINTATIPIDRIDWLIDCLKYIREAAQSAGKGE